MKDMKKTDYLYYLHCLVGLFFMYGFRFLPAHEPLTELGMQVVGIFVGVIIYGPLWERFGQALWELLLWELLIIVELRRP